MTDAPILRTVGLSKRFGGLAAVDEVSIDVRVGEIHAVIGPNGAGKSTLVNLLSCDLAPTAGEIVFDGARIDGAGADRASRLGIGRSYQKTNVFMAFTAFENVRLAAQSRLRGAMRFVRPAAADRTVADAAAVALEAAGLTGRADQRAAALSHGEQRQLEIAMVLATRPRVLLLDEPLAGMGPEEGRAILPLLTSLRANHGVILVEHDMDAVFQVADRLTVLTNGRVLASGAPDAVRNDPEVRRAYLGDGDAP